MPRQPAMTPSAPPASSSNIVRPLLEMTRGVPCRVTGGVPNVARRWRLSSLRIPQEQEEHSYIPKNPAAPHGSTGVNDGGSNS